VEFSSNLSAIYTKWCAQIFPPIFGLFAIFDRNFAKIVALPSNECENCVEYLKEEYLVEKTLKTSKSDNKQQRNPCSICTHRTHGAPDSESDKQTKTNTTFSHLQPARVMRSSPNFAWW